MTWFTSDLHIGHANVIKFCNRPFQSADEMNRELVRRWNAVVKPTDTVYALGDMCFLAARIGVPILSRLLGNKILIEGNHDKYSKAQYLQAGFRPILREARINIGKIPVRLSHYPYWPKTEEEKIELRYEERRPPEIANEWLLCGHVHEKWKQRGRMINVGVDQWNYAPVSISVIESLIAKGEPSADIGSGHRWLGSSSSEQATGLA